MGKLKVLIVDDEHLIRNLLRMRIDWEAQGMEIVGEAANAEEGMGVVEQLQPDIIFTDIYMLWRAIFIPFLFIPTNSMQ